MNLYCGQRETSKLFKQGNEMDWQVFEILKVLAQLVIDRQKMGMRKVKSPTPRCSCGSGVWNALLCPPLDLGNEPWAAWGSWGHHKQERKRFIRKPRWSWKEINSCYNCTTLYSWGFIIPPAHLFFLENQRKLCPQPHNWHHSLEAQWIASCIGATTPWALWGREKFTPSLLGSYGWLNN